jgi:hypothetical protein
MFRNPAAHDPRLHRASPTTNSLRSSPPCR